PRHAPACRRVHDDEAVEGRHELLREPDTARAHVQQLDRLRRHATLGETPQHLNAETVVAAEHVAESGNERARHAAAVVPTTISTTPSRTRTGSTRRCSSCPASGRSSRCPVRMSYRQPCQLHVSSVPTSVL